MKPIITFALLAVLCVAGFAGDAPPLPCYTVTEIDDLRLAVDNRYLWGNANGGSGLSRTYNSEERAKVVEEQVRTFMLAGIRAKQLREADKEKK